MSLIAAWAFDESAGPTLDDAVGTSNLTLAANGDIIAGVHGNAVAPLAGAPSGGGPFASGAIPLSEASALTVSGWVKVALLGSYASMLAIYDGSTRRVRIGRGGANGLHVELLASGGPQSWVFTTDGTLSASEWHHIAVRWNRLGTGTVEILVDGTVRATTVNGSASSTGTMTATTLYVGADPAWTPTAAWDDLRIYDEARTDAQIVADMNASVAPAAPANQAPTVSAGADQSKYVGQLVTLTATATDTDGTIASYDWSQVSGPAVTLAGTGASRTFTPSTVGTYIFSVYATDDDGAASTPDAVQVTVVALPAEPPPPTPIVPNVVKRFGSIERALKAFLIQAYDELSSLDPAVADQRVGGDFAFKKGDPFYIRVDKVGGRADRFEGDFIMDVEVFSVNYHDAESRSLDIEALLLGYPHVVEVDGQKWVFDEVSQNGLPDDLPWEDDAVFRLGATYVITARRR